MKPIHNIEFKIKSLQRIKGINDVLFFFRYHYRGLLSKKPQLMAKPLIKEFNSKPKFLFYQWLAKRRDAKRRQATPSDAKRRQATPSDAKRRQATPSDAKRRQATPSDAKLCFL